MSPVLAPTLSTEEFLALPEDGRDRMLIQGQVWDRKMTYRGAQHSSIMAQLTYLLTHWLNSRGDDEWKVVAGEAGVRLRTDPATIVGVDVAVMRRSARLFSQGARTIFDEPPVLAIEILSASDRLREMETKVDEYLASGVKCVWVISSHFRTVTAYRPDGPPEMFSGDIDLTVDDVLPGFRVPLSRVFETM